MAIKDGKVAAVGPSLDIQGAEEIDATGKHVMPGWTDVHTHYDAQCTWDPLLSPSGCAGVTTVIMGNCGVVRVALGRPSEPSVNAEPLRAVRRAAPRRARPRRTASS